MLSVGLLALALLPVLVAGMALIGSLLRYLVQRALRTPANPTGSWLEAVQRLAEDVALGLSVVVIAYVIGFALGVSIPAGPVSGVLVLLGAAALVFRFSRDRSSLGLPIRRASDSTLLAVVAIGGLLVALIASRVFPYLPFAVYSGNDIRYFTLLTELVQAHGGFAASYGNFVGPTWDVATDPHLTFAGSEAVFTVLNSWAPWSTPQLTSAATIDLNILIPFSAFGLFRRLFPNRHPQVALLAAVALGLFASYPLDFLQWGGIDETMGWFLFPAALALFLQYVEGPPRTLVALFLAGAVFGAIIVVSPLTFFYVASFLLAYAIGLVTRRDGILRRLSGVVAFLALAFLVASPVLYREVSGWLHYTVAVPAGYAGWGTFQTAVIFRPGQVGASLWRFITLEIPLGYVLFFTITAWAGIVLYIRKEALVLVLVLWIAILLLLNTNGPFGLFWIRYPFWTFLYPDRTAHVIFVPLSAGVGLLLARLFELRWPHAPRTPENHWRVLPRRRQAMLFALLISVLVIGGDCAYQVALDNSNSVAWGNALAPSDLVAFQWMQDHLPTNSTILVNPADSGTWIPEFTGLRVFPYGELIDNPVVYDQYVQIPALFNTTSYGPALALLHEYNVSYVYFGARVQYSFSRGLSLPEFAEAPGISPFIVARSVCPASPSNNSSIDFRCNADTATFQGPALLNLTEYHDGSRIGYAWVGVPAGAPWTFTLQTNTTAFPGIWSATISTLPIAPLLYNAGASKLLAFNPVFLELASDSSTVLIAVQGGTVPQM